MIRVKDLYKGFDDQPVLKGINLEIPDGETLVILGESGSGKSVLLRLLVGILKPDRGVIEIDGVNISRLSERELLTVRRNMGYLFQEGALYDFMTVFENVAFPLVEHTPLREDEIAGKVKAMLKDVGLEQALYKYPSQLSGGMKKRVALARSVILNSRFLLCDEPTSGLDPIKSRDITELIRTMARQIRCTTIVTSHDMPNAFRLADRLVLIRQGEIVTEGTPDMLRSSSDRFVREFLE